MPIIKRHNGFKLSQMKKGRLYVKGKVFEFRILKSMGKRYLVFENEAISFSNFNELFRKLKERGTQYIIAFDKYGKSYATIAL